MQKLTRSYPVKILFASKCMMALKECQGAVARFHYCYCCILTSTPKADAQSSDVHLASQLPAPSMPSGIDPTFSALSQLYNAELAQSPGEWYNTSTGSTEVNINGAPYGFFHVPLDGGWAGGLRLGCSLICTLLQ
jgi:hypothetical protein